MWKNREQKKDRIQNDMKIAGVSKKKVGDRTL